MVQQQDRFVKKLARLLSMGEISMNWKVVLRFTLNSVGQVTDAEVLLFELDGRRQGKDVCKIKTELIMSLVREVNVVFPAPTNKDAAFVECSFVFSEQPLSQE